MMLNKLMKIGIIGVLLFYIVIYFIDNSFLNMSTKQLDIKNKIWAHRLNNINSINNALKQKVGGIEIDIFYSSKLDKFTITRDKNTIDDINGLFVEDILLKYSKYCNENNTYIWLDFHGIEFLDKNTILKSLKKLDKIANKYNIKDKLIVESQSASAVKSYTKSGFFTIVLYSFGNDKNIIKAMYKEYKFKILYLMGRYKFDGFSVDYRQYSSIFDNVSKIPVFLFTLNNQNYINQFSKKENIKVILTDKYEKK